MDPIVEFAVKKIAGKGVSAIEGGSGPIGWAIMGTQAIYAVVDHLSEEARDQARKVIGCNHLELCLGWGGTTNLTIEYAHEKRGCAFAFRGVALWHFQPNLDVSKLSALPLRYNAKTGKVGNYPMRLERCRSCFPA